MKIRCKVDIYNRLSIYSTTSGKRRAQISWLGIGRQSVKTDDIFLLLQTQTNKNGTKYKVQDNVEKIFTKFIEEGKLTIRLINPPHDINIQGDKVQLKSFVHVLKLGLSKEANLAVLNLSSTNTKTLPSAPKTKIVIKNVSDYPSLQGFPRVTEELHLSCLQRKSFDRQILKLQHLKILNLSENQLTSLPQELGNLPNLQELNVADNRLGKGPASKWSWLNGSNIRKNLRLLRLSSNEMTYIPEQISKLHGLVSLYANNNLITKLPQGIGNLSSLKYLILSNNNLKYLPGNMRNLRLCELDLSGNTFDFNSEEKEQIAFFKLPALIEFAGQIVIQTRKHYDASTIPFTLVEYLDKANFCICGKACFHNSLCLFIALSLNSITHSIKFSNLFGQDILFECHFCSRKCLQPYSRGQR